MRVLLSGEGWARTFSTIKEAADSLQGSRNRIRRARDSPGGVIDGCWPPVCVDEAVKGVMDFLGVDEGTWKGPVCIADLHLADTWGHVPRMRDDSVGIYDATAAAEGGRADG